MQCKLYEFVTFKFKRVASENNVSLPPAPWGWRTRRRASWWRAGRRWGRSQGGEGVQGAGARQTSRSVQSAPGALPSASSTENTEVKFRSWHFDTHYIIEGWLGITSVTQTKCTNITQTKCQSVLNFWPKQKQRGFKCLCETRPGWNNHATSADCHVLSKPPIWKL